MDVQTRTQLQQHQKIIRPYGTIQEWDSQSNWKYRYVSPFELQRLLWFSRVTHQKLELSERGILSLLLHHVNLGKVEREGCYETFLSILTMIEITGRSDRAVRGYIDVLKRDDWVRVISGTGKGHSNRYHINAPKIVSCYKLSYPEDSKHFQTGNAYERVESVPFPIKRNTVGLRRGRSAALPVNRLAKQ